MASNTGAEAANQAATTVQSAAALTGQVLHGVSPSDFAASLMAASLDRADVLLAMAFLGGAIGAGCWIGWELAKFVFGILGSMGRMALGKQSSVAER